MPILDWLLHQHAMHRAIQAQRADLGRLRDPPRTLTEKIQRSVELYPCNLLFIHRDAEGEPREHRATEIHTALAGARAILATPPAVCVVPVRMMEIWLLIDESALRRAAGNPNGRNTLPMPRFADMEGIPNPKDLLYGLVRDASGLYGRRRKTLHVNTAVHRISELINDFSLLRNLRAFNVLEADLQRVVSAQGWDRPI
jgi:hypothetical protein